MNAGDVIENPVIGERAVVRVGTAESSGELLVADLYVRPGGAVMGEHFTRESRRASLWCAGASATDSTGVRA